MWGVRLHKSIDAAQTDISTGLLAMKGAIHMSRFTAGLTAMDGFLWQS